LADAAAPTGQRRGSSKVNRAPVPTPSLAAVNWPPSAWAAVAQGRPYAIAFVDMRMPPGWDGTQTIAKLWEADPDLQVVICTAYTDQSWEQISKVLVRVDQLPILKKPFDSIEVTQLAAALSHKWELKRQVALKLEELAVRVEEARVANVVKSQFLSTMSHELRTPLSSVLGYADLLKEELLGQPSCLEKIEIIRRDGRHLLTLINDILDLSKIEAGKMTVERSASCPCELVAEVMSMMRVRAAEKGRTLEVEYSWPMPATIQTDAVRLRQILVNLIGNALKFTQTGGVRLIVRPPRPDDAQPRITFEVVDSGIGMSPEQLARLFSPFVQGDASMTRRFGGTGLGLTITRCLARLLGGDISAASTLGQGSIFTLVLETGPLEGVPWVANGQEAIAPTPASEPGVQDARSRQP
jgi:signal transduction histidine kinase